MTATWTPSTPYTPGDIVTATARVDSDFTWLELLTKAGTFVLIITAGFAIVPRIVTVNSLVDGRQLAGGISLIVAAMLFDFGVGQILDWRRKRRGKVLPSGWKVEAEYQSLQEAIDAGWIDPGDELQRHLTDALSVILRHPQLTVDAGTLRLLSRRPKPVRDEKGRWRRVQ